MTNRSLGILQTNFTTSRTKPQLSASTDGGGTASTNTGQWPLEGLGESMTVGDLEGDGCDEVVAILTEEYTGWTWHPNGAWTAHYLDRQSVSCPANSLMRMWKLDTTTSNLRLIKMCYAKFNISAAT